MSRVIHSQDVDQCLSTFSQKANVEWNTDKIETKKDNIKKLKHFLKTDISFLQGI